MVPSNSASVTGGVPGAAPPRPMTPEDLYALRFR